MWYRRMVGVARRSQEADQGIKETKSSQEVELGCKAPRLVPITLCILSASLPARLSLLSFYQLPKLCHQLGSKFSNA